MRDGFPAGSDLGAAEPRRSSQRASPRPVAPSARSPLQRGAMRRRAPPSFAAVRCLVLAALVVVAAPASPPPPPSPPPCSNTVNGVVQPGSSYVTSNFNISGCGNVIGTTAYVVTKATVIGSNNVLGGTQPASQATNSYMVRAVVPNHTAGDSVLTACCPLGLREQQPAHLGVQ